MNRALSDFDPLALRQWLSSMGFPTFVGSSGRVFPEKGFSPIDVLNKLRAKLMEQGVQFHLQHELVGFDNNRNVTFKHHEQEIMQEADYILFALGGASWPKTGSYGSWQAIFESLGIVIKPFKSSNCGMILPDSLRPVNVNATIGRLKRIGYNTHRFENSPPRSVRTRFWPRCSS